jgi:hypothetical protein
MSNDWLTVNTELERHEKPQTVGVLVEIRTEHIVNTSQKRNSLPLLPGCVQQRTGIQVPVSQVLYYHCTIPCLGNLTTLGQ